MLIWSLTTVLLVWSSLSLWASSTTHVSLRVVEVGVHLLILLHDVQQLLKNLSHVWVAGKVIEVEGTSLLSLILLEIGLIDGVFDLDLSLLLDLVVVDHEGLTVIGGVVKSRLGNGGGIWHLEADESEVSVSSFFELDVLDGSELLEEVLKFFFWPLVWEVLDVEVASLL